MITFNFSAIQSIALPAFSETQFHASLISLKILSNKLVILSALSLNAPTIASHLSFKFSKKDFPVSQENMILKILRNNLYGSSITATRVFHHPKSLLKKPLPSLAPPLKRFFNASNPRMAHPAISTFFKML